MKKLMLCISVFFLPAALVAQSAERSVLGSAGKAESTGNITLEWTLGELATATAYYPGGQLTEGFHQPLLSIEPASLFSPVDERIKVFPNPTAALVHVAADPESGETLQLLLFDANGRLLLRKQMPAGQGPETVDLSGRDAGTYFLNICNGSGQAIHAARIMKY
ncbi:MAG: T9SS type A sorting domain-containing protein [Phaeodactylibacter sp.]|nr:T9SS type A sorting domain-containing protein [Phaeodactylibacter sp.]